MTNKTHWLQNPNKNYLGHWDLPNGQDAILTISSAAWEEVENPIIRTSEAKRVIRFKENENWIKPFICNQINAQSILKVTGQKFMEDCEGFRIKIGIGQTKVKGEEVDCLRIRNVKSESLQPAKIDTKQIQTLQNMIDKTDKTAQDICAAYKIGSLAELNISAYESVVKRLGEMINANADN